MQVSRLCITARAPTSRVTWMRFTRRFPLRCLVRVANGRPAWSTVRCDAALATAEPATTVRNLATELDRPKGRRWETVDKWIIFSDLHVSVKTLGVCISVLRRIKKEAVARKAGIVFLGKAIHILELDDICDSGMHLSLPTASQHHCTSQRQSSNLPALTARLSSNAYIGDFWHVRGALPVEPLNAVLREIETWRQPTLMLVGNHDQVSIGGLDHALHPLAAACSAIHILEEPILYRSATSTADLLKCD